MECQAPVPMLLALSTHPDVRGRLIGADMVGTVPEVPTREYRDRFDNRFTRVVAPPGRTTFWSDCAIEVDGKPDDIAPDARQHPIDELPDEVLQFLVPSRYVDSDQLIQFAWSQFGHLSGWALVQAICDHVHGGTTFGYNFGRPSKTASDVFHERNGVCRDFAHLALSLCRAMNIPARYASGYLGDIGVPPSGPGDFCAWFEVFLSGRWYTFDARYNVPRIGRILMVRGADAADVAMITSFGGYRLEYFRVWTQEVPETTSDADLQAALQVRPQGDALVWPSSGRVA